MRNSESVASRLDRPVDSKPSVHGSVIIPSWAPELDIVLAVSSKALEIRAISLRLSPSLKESEASPTLPAFSSPVVSDAGPESLPS